MERGLRDFVGLLHDKTVLLTMIHSLERQKQRFTIRDKSVLIHTTIVQTLRQVLVYVKVVIVCHSVVSGAGPMWDHCY